MNKEKNALPASEDERALRTAMNILAYAECTEGMLRKKLSDKGYSPESAEFAVDYMLKHRYLDEKRYLFRLVECLGNSRLYGRRRIVMGIRQKGFSEETLTLYLEQALARVNDRENCRKALPLAAKENEKKTVEALLRRGFLYADIRAVLHDDGDL